MGRSPNVWTMFPRPSALPFAQAPRRSFAEIAGRTSAFSEHWFERWDRWAVFLGRLTPVMRSFISIPAGVFRAPLVPYTLLTLAGSAIWCFALTGVGWGVGSSYHRFDHAFRYVEYVVVAAVVVLAGALAWRWRRSSKLAQRAEDSTR